MSLFNRIRLSDSYPIFSGCIKDISHDNISAFYCYCVPVRKCCLFTFSSGFVLVKRWEDMSAIISLADDKWYTTVTF